MKITISTSILMFLYFLSTSTSHAQESVPSLAGKKLFAKHCTKCHGNDGTKGLFGAKNLQATELSDADMLTVISNGKRVMPAWKKKLNPEEIRRIMEFVKSLRYLNQK